MWIKITKKNTYDGSLDETKSRNNLSQKDTKRVFSFNIENKQEEIQCKQEMDEFLFFE